jgi:hypothetical protein
MLGRQTASPKKGGIMEEDISSSFDISELDEDKSKPSGEKGDQTLQTDQLDAD